MKAYVKYFSWLAVFGFITYAYIFEGIAGFGRVLGFYIWFIFVMFVLAAAGTVVGEGKDLSALSSRKIAVGVWATVDVTFILLAVFFGKWGLVFPAIIILCIKSVAYVTKVENEKRKKTEKSPVIEVNTKIVDE